MDKVKTLEVINLYRKELEALNVRKAAYPRNWLAPSTGTDQHIILAHCNQMLDQMESFIAEDRLEKTFRWLGFIQGVLWVLRVYSLEELKNHNRPAE